MSSQWFALMRVLAVKPEDLGKLATKPPHVLVPMWTTIAEDEDGSEHASADGQFTIPVARLLPWNPREDRPVTREEALEFWKLRRSWNRVLAEVPAREVLHVRPAPCPTSHGRAGIAADTDAAKRLAAAESAALDGAWRMISAAGWTPDRFRLEHHVGEPRRTLLMLRAGPGAPVDAPLFEVVVNAPLFDAPGPAVRVTSRWLADIPPAPGAAGTFTVTGTIDGEPRTYTVSITTTHGRVTRPWSTAQFLALGLDAAAPAHAGDFLVELEAKLAIAGYGIASYRVSGLAHALEVYRNR